MYVGQGAHWGHHAHHAQLNYTGQRLDGTGLLYYHARYYDPGLARFISPDSIVPGASLGAGGALGTVGQEQNSLLTVDFHEGTLLSGLNSDNALILQKGYWFQLSGQDRRQRQAREPWGPANPQALSRYAYVLGNPLRYVDPTGHFRWVAEEDDPLTFIITLSFNEMRQMANAANTVAALLNVVAGAAAILGALSAMGVITWPAAPSAFLVSAIMVTAGSLAWLDAAMLTWLIDLGYHVEVYCVKGRCGVRLVQGSDKDLEGVNFCTRHKNGTVDCLHLDGGGGGGGGADDIAVSYSLYLSLHDPNRLGYYGALQGRSLP